MRSLVMLILLILAPRLAAAASTKPAEIDALIARLGDPDPDRRQNASEQLATMGDAARPQLVKAARSSSAAIASPATELLMKLPWAVASDPKDVRDDLADYGKSGNEGRQKLIGETLVLRTGSEPALLRITREDPSNEVSWLAAEILALIEDPKIAKTIRKIDLTDERVQVLTLAARAFLPVDRQKGMELLRRAVEANTDDDSGDVGKLDFAYRLLMCEAMDAGKPKEAASVLRKRAQREGTEKDASGAVFSLLAFYADFGADTWPGLNSPELEEDLQEFGAYLGKPEMLHALSRIERASADGSNLMAEALSRCAIAASLTNTDAHLRIANTCAARAWDAEARSEVADVIGINAQKDDELLVKRQMKSRVLLAEIAQMNFDHQSAADHLDKALSPTADSAFNRHYIFTLQNFTPDTRKAEMTCNQMQADREAGKVPAADRALENLKDLPTPDSDTAIAVVRELRAQHRDEDAKEYFNKAYEGQQIKPDDRLRMAQALNNLAWLCARCDQHLDEAISLAERAVALEPENYASLDTAASAHFAAGHFAEAVRLEKRALIFRPNDTFMQKQLETFEKGGKK